MWRPEETEQGIDLVWSQPENGIAPSALKGNANLQNVNIATEPGQVMAAFARTNQAQTALSAQTLTPDGSTLFDGPATLKSGTWIKVTASTVTSVTAATNPTTATINYLIVAGGGGGGSVDNSGASGGGGAGEFLESTTSLSVGSYLVTVGAGGAGGEIALAGVGGRGDNGEDSSIETVDTAVGGGGGGIGLDNISPTTGYNGLDGGSGGGGGAGNTGNVGTGGSSETGGNDGGAGFDSGTANLRAGGGGGGAGGAGVNGSSGTGGTGGAGSSSSISGTAVTYATGGGGGADGTQGIGGSGGIHSNSGGNNGAGGSADANTGSGGGGSSTSSTTGYDGGDGGSGIVYISYTTGAMKAIGGEVYESGGNTIHKFTSSDTFEVLEINPGGLYYVSYKDGSNKIKLSEAYDPYGTDVLTHGTTGSITFETVAVPGRPIAKATERYFTTTGEEYRYYILDANSYVWVYDTKVYADTLAANSVGVTWMLPDPTDYSSVPINGIGVLNGWLTLVRNDKILMKPTVKLGAVALFMEGGYLTNPYPNHPNYVMTGSQGTLLYTDGNFIGEVFPTTSLITSIANIQSYCSYTASSTVGTIATLIGGSIPASGETRIPVVFFTAEGGTLPTAISPNTVYFVKWNFASNTFTVFSSSTSTTALDIATGASGTQYFNTFYPIGTDAGADGTNPTVQFTPQRVNLPFYETATRLLEIGNNVFIGCKGNIVYPWNQVDALPSDVITLPESDVQTMLNVNNSAYIFAGDKGNIYIANGVSSTLVLTIPDYTAGVPGTANSYIEPTFVWGDAAYVRGRVYCSVLDQTESKAGNCGGVWSFIPSENIDPSQDVGMALRLENQNSYGDYDGYAPILITDQEQDGKSPKYWAAWQDSYDTGTATYGIDYSTENPVTQYVIETDLIPTGTHLSQQTFTQVEYKLAVPPTGSDSVDIYYRQNPTAAWTALTDKKVQTTGGVYSGLYQVNFEKTEWLQFRAVVTTSGDASTSTFVPLTEIRVR